MNLQRSLTHLISLLLWVLVHVPTIMTYVWRELEVAAFGEGARSIEWREDEAWKEREEVRQVWLEDGEVGAT